MSGIGRAPHWWEQLVPKLYDHDAAILMAWLGRVWVLWRKRRDG